MSWTTSRAAGRWSFFQRNYLSAGQAGGEPIEYRHRYIAPSNTGVPSGFDLDNDGSVGGGNDAFGFGAFPGQFGMGVLSRDPIRQERVRTFQRFLWKDMPGARLPDDPATPSPADWYSPQELEVVRLSSKSHWDLPIRVGGRTVHLLASHPTPPVSTAPRTATACATPTRSASGPTTCGRRAAATSTTTRAVAAAWRRARPS